MANVTDPLVNQLAGSDPQNLMEYITRQKIYESRFWKEECFGLTVTDVLEKAVHTLQCVGALPSRCLALTLKLLQLRPEHALIQSAFVNQTEFKYVRAIGCLYIRMTSRPAEIYESLEPVYADYRKLRVWTGANNNNKWDLITMDQFVHQLLSPNTRNGNCLGIALPRLPARRVLQEAGYLPEGPRMTALQDILQEHARNDDNTECGDRDHGDNSNAVLNYLRHKAVIEKSPPGVAAWEKRQQKLSSNKHDIAVRKEKRILRIDGDNKEEQPSSRNADREVARSDVETGEEKEPSKDRKKKKEKKERNYDNLFKKTSKTNTSKEKVSSASTKNDAAAAAPAAAEDSEDYWNEQRAKLGLSKLK